MPTPGDIIKEAKITSRDPLGRYWFKSEKQSGYILPKYAPDELEVNASVKNLVAVGNKIDPRKFALCNFEEHLINRFYIKGVNVSKSAGSPKLWKKKWEKGAGKPLDVQCLTPKEKTKIPKPPDGRKWRFARAPEWIMPVQTSHYYECPGKESFCPNFLGDGLPSVYPPELYSDEHMPPLCYDSVLYSDSSEPMKPIRIYLHGTLDPLKWHYGIWNHLLSGSLNSDSREIKLWEKWLGIDLPNSSEVNAMFKGCRAYRKNGNGNCRPCRSEHFQKVHEKIKSFSNLYWQKLVTFWESDATKEVKINESSFFNSIDVKISEKKFDKYPFLLMNGWSYDYDDENDHPAIIHLNAVTFYFRNNDALHHNRSELKNVIRLSE